jgi:hypothetical protein
MKIVLSEKKKDHPLDGLDVAIESHCGDRTVIADFTVTHPLRNRSYFVVWRRILTDGAQRAIPTPDADVLDVVRHDHNPTKILYRAALEYAQAYRSEGDTFRDETGFRTDSSRRR